MTSARVSGRASTRFAADRMYSTSSAVAPGSARSPEKSVSGVPGGADRVIGRIAAGGVRQKEIFIRIDVIEQRLLAAVEIHPAHGHRHHVGATGLERAGGFLKRFVFAGPNDQAGTELPASNNE